MTFDDGIVGIYELRDVSEKGKKPIKKLVLAEKFFFSYDVLGINRYYTALQANQSIEAVINVPGWNDINSARHVAVLENGNQYRITMTQPQHDEAGLRITKLSLERIMENYAIEPGKSEDGPCGCQ